MSCEFCSEKAKFICQNCGRHLCDFHISSDWLCPSCKRHTKTAKGTEIGFLPKLLVTAGVVSFIAGFILLFSLPFMVGDMEVATGGLILIGPIPIIVGGGMTAGLIVIGVIIGIFLLILYFLLKGLWQ